MAQRIRVLPLALVCLLIAGLSLAVRGPVPLDETRYLAVAWEMWLRDDFLVPYLNGDVYSHKPPLLFWLIHAGWALFGVNDWWPQLLPALFSLAALFLLQQLAKGLWPESTRPMATAPLIALSCFLWAVFTTAIMFDMLLTTCVLLGIYGVAQAWRGHAVRGWALFAVAIGLGLLAKGPVVLLHILPLGLLAPLWHGGAVARWGRWYAGGGAALSVGVTIALMWAIPAAQRGGDGYAQAILWGQTADRMVDSFAHARPFWWYLPLLPLLLFPWFAWPPLWRAIGRLLRSPVEPSVRFLLAWLLPVFIGFSLISGKQPHYLLPVVPAFALIAAHALSRNSQPQRTTIRLPGALLGSAATAGMWGVATGSGLPSVPMWPLVLTFTILLLLAAMLVAVRAQDMDGAIRTLGFAGVTTVGILVVGLVRPLWPAYDVGPAARAVAGYQRDGTPVANLARYYGQFQFAGRLAHPIESVDIAHVQRWANRHPDGKLIHYYKRLPADVPQPEFAQPYRGGHLGIWPASSVLKQKPLLTLLRTEPHEVSGIAPWASVAGKR